MKSLLKYLKSVPLPSPLGGSWRGALLLFLLSPFGGVGGGFAYAQFESAEVIPFPGNSTKSEFGPMIVGDTLYYSRIDEIKEEENQTKEPKAFYRIRRAELDHNGQVVSTVVFDREKSSRYHDGPLCYSSAAGCYFITRSSFDEAEVKNKVFKKRMVELKLDMYDPVSRKSTPFPHNVKGFSVVHPTTNAKGDVLYFASDMEDGFGGHDIYMSQFVGGQWREPVNLGSAVNTDKDELYPFMSSEDELFFTSNRSGGKGGLDIYMSRKTASGSFSAPILLPEPINSASDDFSITLSENKRFGALASNREGARGLDDIFMIKLAAWTTDLLGTAVDKISGLPVSGVNVQLFDADSIMVASVLSDDEGAFQFEIESDIDYTVTANKEAYRTLSQTAHYHSKNLLFRMEGVHALQLYVLDGETHQPLPSFKVRNLTDGQTWEGDMDYALVELAANAENQLRVEADGFFMTRVIKNTIGLPYGMDKETVVLYPDKKDAVFELKNINYELAKWTLMPESKLELNKLVNIMKENAEVIVELRSHTDSRGSDAYNMTLSQKRSASCREYLIENGIASNRITSVGFGETRLLNHCGNGVNCPEEMHFANRRTEIKFDRVTSLGARQAEIDAAIKASGNRFFLISGSFKSEQVALRFYDDLRHQDVECILLGRIRGDFYAVALEGFSSLNDASERLKELQKKPENVNMWIYDFGRY